jgi:hypothetical protein
MVIHAVFLYTNNVIKPMFVSVVIGLFAGLMNYIGLRKLLLSTKVKAYSTKLKTPIAVMLYSY